MSSDSATYVTLNLILMIMVMWSWTIVNRLEKIIELLENQASIEQTK